MSRSLLVSLSVLALLVGVRPASAQTPVNDDCANAIVLSSAYQTVTWDNTGATTDGSSSVGFCWYDLSGGDFNYNDVWYRWTAPDSGCVYVSHLGLAGVDTRLTVYDLTACPDDPASIIACSDDEVLPATSPFEAGLDLNVTAGNEYLIRTGTASEMVPTGVFQMIIAQGSQAYLVQDPGLVLGGTCIEEFVYTESCSGDGGDQMGCTPCPCNNEAPAGSLTGCLHSAGVGAALIGYLSASVAASNPDDLRFDMQGGTPNSFAVLISGASIAPRNIANPCFGSDAGVQSSVLDGLRCAVMNVQRHGGRPIDFLGDVGLVGPGWGGESGPPAGIAATAGFVAGETRHFQAFYRELPGVVCSTQQNTSQSVTVTFTP